jgi:hypothetical protein
VLHYVILYYVLCDGKVDRKCKGNRRKKERKGGREGRRKKRKKRKKNTWMNRGSKEER